MAATVRAAIRELLEKTMATIDTLLVESDRELAMPSSHVCAQGKDVWTLITNDIDHEKIHTGQILEGRYESRITASPLQRLVAEWLVERSRLIGSLIGLTDRRAIQRRDRAWSVDVPDHRQTRAYLGAGHPEDDRSRQGRPGHDRAGINVGERGTLGC